VKVAADGEVLVKGAGVFDGYIGEVLADDVIDEAGFLHTGDLGVLDPDGKLVLVGRKSEIFKTSTGRKVAPIRIEGKLVRIAAVDHAVILGAGEKLIVAILTPTIETAHTLSDELVFRVFAQDIATQIDFVLADEPSYYRPDGLIVLRQSFSIDNGELTSNLKLRRNVIHDRYHSAAQSLYASLETRAGNDEDFIEMIEPDTIILNTRVLNQ